MPPAGVTSRPPRDARSALERLCSSPAQLGLTSCLCRASRDPRGSCRTLFISCLSSAAFCWCAVTWQRMSAATATNIRLLNRASSGCGWCPLGRVTRARKGRAPLTGLSYSHWLLLVRNSSRNRFRLPSPLSQATSQYPMQSIRKDERRGFAKKVHALNGGNSRRSLRDLVVSSEWVSPARGFGT